MGQFRVEQRRSLNTFRELREEAGGRKIDDLGRNDIMCAGRAHRRPYSPHTLAECC
jgi:hypothetical protein